MHHGRRRYKEGSYTPLDRNQPTEIYTVHSVQTPPFYSPPQFPLKHCTLIGHKYCNLIRQSTVKARILFSSAQFTIRRYSTISHQPRQNFCVMRLPYLLLPWWELKTVGRIQMLARVDPGWASSVFRSSIGSVQ